MKIILDNIIFSLQKSGGISNVWFEFIYRIIRRKDIKLSFIDFENQNIFFQKLLKDNYSTNITHSKRFIERYRNPLLKISTKNLFFTHHIIEHVKTHMPLTLPLYMISLMNIIIMDLQSIFIHGKNDKLS